MSESGDLIEHSPSVFFQAAERVSRSKESLMLGIRSVDASYRHRTSDAVTRDEPRKFHAISSETRRLFVSRGAEAWGLKARLFDRLIELKVATAEYAMHLSPEARDRLFAEFDFLLDDSAWDEEDTLPDVGSFRQFIRWMIFTRDDTWSSLGVSDDGNILVAWVRSSSQMTANFGKRVKWSQSFEVDGERQLAAGDFGLEHFAKTSTTFLNGF